MQSLLLGILKKEIKVAKWGEKNITKKKMGSYCMFKCTQKNRKNIGFTV